MKPNWRQNFLTWVVLLLAALLLVGLLGVNPGQASTPAAQPTWDATQPVVARVDYATRANLEALSSTIDIWEVHAEAGYLIALLRPEDVTRLQAAGYTVTVDAARTAALHTPRLALPGQVNGIPGYSCYRTVEETHDAMQNLVNTYPTLASRSDIGNSWEKSVVGGIPGYDIYVLKLTNQNIPGPKPIFFLMGAIHAREYTTAEMALRFAEDLLANYGTDADATWLLDHFELHVVPMTNPDGRKKAETGLSWRKNTDNDDGCNNAQYWGVDLNRNHGFEWGGPGASTDPCDLTYRGPIASSEPEVRAIQNYVRNIFPDQRGPLLTDPAPQDATGVFISLHSYSELVIWPWGFTSAPAPNAAGLQTLGRKMAYFNGYDPGQSVTLYPTSGTSDDWAYGELGVAAYTFEMGTEFFQSCSYFESTIYPDNLEALYYAFKAARQPYLDPAGPEIINVTVTTDASQQATIQATANDQRYGGSGEPTQNIATARYALDRLSWQEGVTFAAMDAADGSFNSKNEAITANLDTACLTPGRHTVYIEGQDAAGNWGVPSAGFLDVGERAGVNLLPAAQSAQAHPGETLTYTLQAANTGNITDTFTITLTSLWPASLAPLTSTLTLPPCSPAISLNVTVTIPLTASPGETDMLTVALTSHADPGQQVSAAITSQAAAPDFTPSPTATPTATLPPTPRVYLPIVIR
jgi:uncharacterized repeat protein (TIGR01451 family)